MHKPVYKSRIEYLLDLKGKMMGKTIFAKDLARHVGVSKQTISNWMSPDGVNSLPSAEHQLALVEFFGVPWTQIWRLYDDQGEECPQFMGDLVA